MMLNTFCREALLRLAARRCGGLPRGAEEAVQGWTPAAGSPGGDAAGF
jgi:hypothetical protein